MCDHKKNYREDVILATYPAKYLWKCENCDETGYDCRYSEEILNKFRKSKEDYFMKVKQVDTAT